MLKASFMSAYVKTILTSLKFKTEDILHTGSYYEFNIQDMEFGEQSKWKRVKKRNGNIGTVSWLWFVFSCKISEEATGLVRLRNILDKKFWAMKAHAFNPIGPIVFDHCQKNEERILSYMLKANNERMMRLSKRSWLHLLIPPLRMGTISSVTVIWTSSWLTMTFYASWKMSLDTNPGQMLQMWNVQSASKVTPRGKPCLTGTFKKRSTTSNKCELLLSLVIFPNPKNFLLAHFFIAVSILGCTISWIKNKVILLIK